MTTFRRDKKSFIFLFTQIAPPSHTENNSQNILKKPKTSKRPKRFIFDYNTNQNQNSMERSPRNHLIDPYQIGIGGHGGPLMSRVRGSRGMGSLRSFGVSSIDQYLDSSPSSRRSFQDQLSSYENYFSNQIRRAENPSLSFSPSYNGDEANYRRSRGNRRFGIEPRRRGSDIGMYSNNPGSPSDAEISDLLKNDKDLQELARSMPAGTKVLMNDNKREGDYPNDLRYSSRGNEEMAQARDMMPR